MKKKRILQSIVIILTCLAIFCLTNITKILLAYTPERFLGEPVTYSVNLKFLKQSEIDELVEIYIQEHIDENFSLQDYTREVNANGNYYTYSFCKNDCVTTLGYVVNIQDDTVLNIYDNMFDTNVATLSNTLEKKRKLSKPAERRFVNLALRWFERKSIGKKAELIDTMYYYRVESNRLIFTVNIKVTNSDGTKYVTSLMRVV